MVWRTAVKRFNALLSLKPSFLRILHDHTKEKKLGIERNLPI